MNPAAWMSHVPAGATQIQPPPQIPPQAYAKAMPLGALPQLSGNTKVTMVYLGMLAAGVGVGAFVMPKNRILGVVAGGGLALVGAFVYAMSQPDLITKSS